MKWQARTALAERLAQLQTEAAPYLEDLRGALAKVDPSTAASILRENLLERGLDFAQSGRHRRRSVAALPPDQRPFAYYAAAAWTAKALLLAEHLERLQLEPGFPRKFAADAMLTLVGRYEQEDEPWLWPFPGLSPWDHLED